MNPCACECEETRLCYVLDAVIREDFQDAMAPPIPMERHLTFDVEDEKLKSQEEYRRSCSPASVASGLCLTNRLWLA
jgi:hypothetical protein